MRDSELMLIHKDDFLLVFDSIRTSDNSYVISSLLGMKENKEQFVSLIQKYECVALIFIGISSFLRSPRLRSRSCR